MAISVVQSASSGASNPPLSFASSVTAGNSVFLIVQAYNTSGTSPSVASSSVKLNSSTVTGTVAFFNPGTTGGVNSALSGNVAWISVWMLPNCPGGNSVDFTITGAAGVLGIEIYEVSGLGTSPSLDKSSSGSSTSLTTASSGASGAITASPEFIIGGAMIFSGASAPAGWTTLNPSGDAWGGYQIATSSGGSYTWSQSSAGTPWSAFVATVQGTVVVPPPVQMVTSAPYRPPPPPLRAPTLVITGPLPATPATLAAVTQSAGIPYRPPWQITPRPIWLAAGLTTQGTAALTGAGTLAALAVQTAPAAPAGAGTLAALAAQSAPAAPSGSGALAALAAQGAPTTLTGAGVVNANSGASVQGTAALTGAGTVAVPAVVQQTTVSLTGAGTVAASAVQGATAALSGAGTVTPPPPPFQVARSVPTEGDPRDGKKSTAAVATSKPGVS